MDALFKSHFSQLSQHTFIVKAVQNSLLQEVLECFQCVFCKETSHPPISITSCCESIIGCQKCTSTWLNAEKDTCPKCGKEGFSNMLITMKGFDEFLNKMHWFDSMLTTKVTLYIHTGIKKWIYYMNSTTARIIHCIKFLF